MLLNDATAMDAAQALGKMVAKEKGEDEVKAAEIFRRCLTRPPATEELQLLTEFAGKQRAAFCVEGIGCIEDRRAGRRGRGGEGDVDDGGAVDFKSG